MKDANIQYLILILIKNTIYCVFAAWILARQPVQIRVAPPKKSAIPLKGLLILFFCENRLTTKKKQIIIKQKAMMRKRRIDKFLFREESSRLKGSSKNEFRYSPASRPPKRTLSGAVSLA